MSCFSLNTDLLSSCSAKLCVTISGWLSSQLTSSELQSWQELLAFEPCVFVLVSLCLQYCANELDGPCRASETATGCHGKSVPKIAEGGTEDQSTPVCRGIAAFSFMCALWFHSSLSLFRELRTVFGFNLGIFMSKTLQGSV